MTAGPAGHLVERCPASGPDSEYARAAARLAARLAALTETGPDGAPCWSGDDVDPRRSSPTRVVLDHGRLDDGLLTGRSGIAVALAAAAGLPSASPTWASLARAAARACVDAASARSSSSDGSLSRGGSPPGSPPGGGSPSSGALGWSSGWLGIARAGDLVGTWTADARLVAAAGQLARRAVDALADLPDRCPDYPDLLDGVAGHLTAVLAARLPSEAEADRRAVATGLLDRLVAWSSPEGPGRAGPVAWPMAGTGPAVIGLAHGGSGITIALAAARRAGLGDGDRLDALIERTLRWEDAHFRAASGGWPDLRSPRPAPGLAWCHGAPGVGVAAAYRRLSGLEAGSEPTFARAIRMTLAHGQPAGSTPFDGTLCHGLTGAIELLLLGAEAWPAAGREHLATARLLARHLTRAGRPGRPGWVCGVTGGRTPNLLTGLAGVALTLVRCHDPALAPSLAHPGLPAAEHVAPRGGSCGTASISIPQRSPSGQGLDFAPICFFGDDFGAGRGSLALTGRQHTRRRAATSRWMHREGEDL